MEIVHKGSDKEGRIRLGNSYANKQWQFFELDNGSIVLIPMVPVTNEEAASIFNKVFEEHKKTIDSLQ